MPRTLFPAAAAVRPVRAAVVLLAALLLTVGLSTVVRPATPARAATAAAVVGTPGAHTVTYDGYSFSIDGKRTYLWSGEFHPYRLPSPSLWRDVLQKMKAAGFNATSIYFDWGYHSPRPGVYDFTGVRDMDQLLDIAQEVGIDVIARPAPYINAEVDGGGLPAWLDTLPGVDRSADPLFLKYADQWLTQIDAILQRHQLTNGTGTVIAYQVENEYYNGNAAGRAYMQHLEDKARADGITVPLTGNNNGTFNSGTGALDVDGPDSYPQGFNCSNPTVWNGVPDISYDHPAGKPLYTPEFQGGAFDPWGGPGYAKCAQLIDDQFANVFYKQNIAVGATAQSFYMLYGGTSWGWNAIPQNYTSYDYGAAITEGRQLDPKYDEDKLIGYFTQAVAPLTKTDSLPPASLTSATLVDTARRNPDTGTQFHTLRHADSTSTAVDTTHLALDLNAKSGYTYDDTASTLQYAGSWTHVGAEQSYTAGDYQHTESFSNTTGDHVDVPFTGTAVRFITSKTNNHGIADISLDGTKVASVDTYAASNANQVAAYQVSGLTAGAHTLRIAVSGTKNAASSDTFVSVDAVDVPTTTGTAGYYATVPQQPGTGITLNGRQSKIILADYDLGQSQLQYSTSELMTDATIGGRDVAVFYGDAGQAGETVLHDATKPSVKVLAGGPVTSTWSNGDLRLNYTHHGLSRVLVTEPGKRPLLLLLADHATAGNFWQLPTASGPVLAYGSHLLRTASTLGGGLRLTGDTGTDGAFEVWAGAPSPVTWNGAPVATTTTTSGSRATTLPSAAPVTLPALTGWKTQDESPETAPGFDDSTWAVADRTTTNSYTTPGTLPVLFADDYGFHTGNTWYRGRFRIPAGATAPTGISLSALSGGTAGAFSVWVNGTFVSTVQGSTLQKTFAFPAGTLRTDGGDNVVSVLTVDMGHEEDYQSDNSNKTARGLTGAKLVGVPLAQGTQVTWRIQGTRGGENGLDATRGPLNTGGLYGERAGWSLPGFPDTSWKSVSLPTSKARAGVTWYRTTTTLAVPPGQDTSIALNIADDPSRHYRAEIYVNGWQLGNYVNDIGPQHTFPIPNGILRTQGANTIAIAVWDTDATTGGLGTVSLVDLGSYASSLQVTTVESPGYKATRYALPAAATATARLVVPETVTAGRTFTATGTLKVAKGAPVASSLVLKLTAPSGWTVGRPSPVVIGSVATGSSRSVTWQVTAPTKVAAVNPLVLTFAGEQDGTPITATDERIVGTPPPSPVVPRGTVAVSALPFLSSTNGWGPVERDTSNGESAAGDGRTITIAGTTYPKGLGTNSVSDVEVNLGGNCSRFTATVGVDDEVGNSGSVTFAVVVDGATVTTTPTLTGSGPAATLDVAVTGGQVLDLVVGDGGDGNGLDHADWAVPTLTCAA